MVGCVPNLGHTFRTCAPCGWNVSPTRHPRSIGVLTGKLASTCAASTPGGDQPCAHSHCHCPTLVAKHAVDGCDVADCPDLGSWPHQFAALSSRISSRIGSRCATFHLTSMPTIQTSAFGIRGIDQNGHPCRWVNFHRTASCAPIP